MKRPLGKRRGRFQGKRDDTGTFVEHRYPLLRGFHVQPRKERGK